MRLYALSLSFGLLIANCALADSKPATCAEVQTCGSADCCAHCGSHCCCEKYCKVVCEMKEVKKTVWAVKCEDFCPPLPACPLHCKEACESCGQQTPCTAECESCDKACDPCAELQKRNYLPPTCGKMRVKKTLEKKEVVCKIPSYKCVVVYACANCGPKCEADKAEQQVPIPAPPAPSVSNDKSQSIPLPPLNSAFSLK